MWPVTGPTVEMIQYYSGHSYAKFLQDHNFLMLHRTYSHTTLQILSKAYPLHKNSFLAIFIWARTTLEGKRKSTTYARSFVTSVTVSLCRTMWHDCQIREEKVTFCSSAVTFGLSCSLTAHAQRQLCSEVDQRVCFMVKCSCTQIYLSHTLLLFYSNHHRFQKYMNNS